MMSNSGVYMIKSKRDDKLYVGSSAYIKGRWDDHIYTLEHNTHHCRHLQNAWNRYGADNFEFVIVELVKWENGLSEEEFRLAILAREQVYLDTYWDNSKECYNILPTAGSHLGAKRSPEARANMSKAQMGSKKPGNAIALKGKKQSPETQAKRSASLITFYANPEAREQQGLKSRGKKIPYKRKVGWVKKICACGCGTEFEVQPHKVGVKYVFGHQMRGRTPHNKGKVKHPCIQLECLNCDNPFDSKYDGGRKRYNQYCSARCRNQDLRKHSSIAQITETQIPKRRFIKSRANAWTPEEDQMAINNVCPPGRTQPALDNRRAGLKAEGVELVRHPIRPLDKMAVNAICQQLVDGVDYKIVANNFSVSETTIYGILKGRTWQAVSSDYIFPKRQIRVKAKSGHRYVYWNPVHENWKVKIYRNGKMITIGTFKDIDDAVKARDLATNEHKHDLTT